LRPIQPPVDVPIRATAWAAATQVNRVHDIAVQQINEGGERYHADRVKPVALLKILAERVVGKRGARQADDSAKQRYTSS
jgi:hypothetical protein